jgi:hypothetical protein
VLFVETGRQTKIGQLDMAKLVNEDIVRFDITKISKIRRVPLFNPPMDKAEIVNRLDGEDALRHIKLCHVFREGIVLDQPIVSAILYLAFLRHCQMRNHSHGHQIASRQKLHNQVQILRILKRVIQLHDPSRITLCQDISLCPDMCQLVLFKHFVLF